MLIGLTHRRDGDIKLYLSETIHCDGMRYIAQVFGRVDGPAVKPAASSNYDFRLAGSS